MSSKLRTLQRSPVELTRDPTFARRVIRLTITSAVVLGLIWLLSVLTLEADAIIDAGLLAGWLLMPSILGLSLWWPRLRYALIIPSLLVSFSLLAICTTALPDHAVTGSGWLLLTGGVLFGGFLGVWFWFRWLPVPSGLADPFSSGRWRLITVHVSLIITGLVLAALSAAR